MRRVICTGSSILRRNYASAIAGPDIKKEKPDIIPLNREGDGGFSKTVTGEVFPKDYMLFNAIGTAEELLCAIGVAREHGVEQEHDYTDRLKRIQTIIIDISTAVSFLGSNKEKTIPQNYTAELELWIKEYSSELPKPERYVIPGGGVASASLHLARSICRRTERVLVPLVREEGLDKGAIIYLNRLADFLFVVARIATKRDKRSETIYTPIKTTETIQDQ